MITKSLIQPLHHPYRKMALIPWFSDKVTLTIMRLKDKPLLRCHMWQWRHKGLPVKLTMKEKLESISPAVNFIKEYKRNCKYQNMCKKGQFYVFYIAIDF